MKKVFTHRSAFVVLVFMACLLANSDTSYSQTVLYGMTQNGGAYNKGVPYQINTDGSGFLSFKDFDGDNGEHPGDGARFTQLSGKRFGPGFVQNDFVGLTELGYQNLGYGNRVQIRPGENGLIPPFRFSLGGYYGSHPTGGFLMTPDATLYGLTSQDGQFGGGTMFSMPDIFGNGAQVMHAFDGVNTGRSPKGTLIRGKDGRFYGTTEFGGTSDRGVVFTFTSNGVQKLLDFDGALKGSYPTGSLVLATDEKLYGMTKNGGTTGAGVIFSILHDGTGYTKLLDLNGPVTGGNPKGSLVQFTDGKLYGMTSTGGAYGYGTIFSITLTGTFTKIHDFNGTNGKYPVGDLLVDPTGIVMYGVAFAGGTNDKGVLFKLVNGNQFTKLYDYNAATGANPVGTLAMSKKDPDLTFAPIPVKTTLSAPFPLPIVAEGDAPVYVVSRDTSVVVVQGNTLVVKNSGYAELVAYQLGNQAYLPATASTVVEVKKSKQTISFAPLPSKKFGDAPFSVTATSTSGLPVIFGTSDPSVATFEEGKIVIRGGGHVNVIAYQYGNAKYEAATTVARHLFVDRAEQKITIQPISGQVCCNSFAISATASSNLDVLFKSSDRMKIDIYGNIARPIGVGVAEIIAYHPGNKSFRPAEARATVEIVMGVQSIYFYVNEGPRKLGDAPEYVSAGSNRGLPVTYTSNPPGIAVVEQGQLYFLAEGTTTITASQAGSADYYPAIPVTRTITVNPPTTPGVGNTIVMADLLDRTAADPPFNLIGTATSGLPVSYASSNPAVATVSGSLVTIKGSGSTTITATQPGKEGVAAATPVVKVLQVKKMQQYLSMSDSRWETFGVPPIPLPTTTSAGLPVTYTLSDSGIGSIDNYYLTIKGAGYLTVTASQSGNDKYEAMDPVSTQFRIYALNDNIYFQDLSGLTYGDAPFSLIGGSLSGAPVTFTSSDPNIVSIVGSRATIKGAGIVTIIASTESPGYGLAELHQRITVKKATQTISFQALENKKFGDPPIVLSPASTSNLPVVLTTPTPGVVKISGNVVTIVGNGTAEIMASHPGTDNFEPAESIYRKFEVAGASNTYEMVGATLAGGPNHSGVLFSMKSDGTSFGYLKQYNAITSPVPQAGFIKGIDGKLYGTFMRGGSGNVGSIVRLEADGTGLTYLHDLSATDGKNPSGNLIQAANGDLYGTTQFGGTLDGGTIFRVKPDGNDFTVLYNFSALGGKYPRGGLVQATNGKFYGITPNGGFNDYGTIFSINGDGSGFSVIFHLNDHTPVQSGNTPNGELTQGPDGFLYGTTTNGGIYNKGTLFKIAVDGTGFTKLVDFNGTSTGIVPASGLLLASDGKLYGATAGGGVNLRGTIFSVNTNGTNYNQLFSFDAGNSGNFPIGKLLEGTDGSLYGMTIAGGNNDQGTIFRIAKNGTSFHKMVDLDDRARSSLGASNSLIEGAPGNFFGMTSLGGVSNSGAVFKLTGDDTFTIISNFQQQESTPRNLVVDPAGEYYYGVTQAQNWNEGGTIFRMKASGSSYETIYDVPVGDIITVIFYASTGHLWVSGIHGNENFMFKMKADGSGREDITAYNNALAQNRKPAKVMIETPGGEIFAGTDGNWSTPIFFKIKNDGTGFLQLFGLGDSERITGNLLLGSDGNFYMAYGSDGVYKFTPDGTLTRIFSHPADAHGPTVNKIIEMNGGRLGIVTRVNGSGSYGTIFSIEKDGTGYVKIYEPKLTDGISPVDMLQSIDGWLYVASEYGGLNQKGVIYKVRPDGSGYQKIREFNGDDGETPNGIFFKRAVQSCTFDLLPEKKTSDPAFFPRVITSSGAPVQFKSSNPGVAVIENGLIKPVAKGTTVITAVLPANANYYKGEEIARTLVVVKGGQTIAFDAFPKFMLQDLSLDLAAVASSGLPVIYQSSDPSVAAVSGSHVTFLKYGSTTITASQAGDDNFDAASSVSRVLTIRDVTQSISFTNPGAKVVGANAFPLMATASSGLAVQFTTTADEITLSNGMVTVLKAGNVTVTASQSGDDEINAALPVDVSFCINPPKPVITESGPGADLVFYSSNLLGNQWYLNNSIMTGYTANTIHATEEGTYTVVTTVEGCASEQSESKLLITTGVAEDPSIQIDVFPNPVERDLNVEITGNFSHGAVVELLDVIGKRLAVREMSGAGRQIFEVQSNGVFFIRVTINGKVVVRKVVKP